MDVIDEDGRLLGRVNVVDALVVLVVLAIVVAGATFVLSAGGEPERSEPTYAYATVDLGSQPAYVAELVDAGDTVERADGPNVTVTDVYATGHGGDRHVRVRARIPGERTSDGFSYDGAPLRVGRTLDLATSEYRTKGTVTAVDASGPDLPVRRTDVLLRTNLSVGTADAVDVDDEYRLDGRVLGTVESVSVHGSKDPGRVIAYVGVTYRTYGSGGEPRFGGTAVQEGTRLPFETDGYAFEGTVVRQNALQQRGREVRRTAVLKLENADPDLAAAIDPGMEERVLGETVARVSDVRVDPSTVVIKSRNGTVFSREHPVEKDVTMTVDLRVRVTRSGLRFEDAPLRQGRSIILDFGTVTVEATVVSVS